MVSSEGLLTAVATLLGKRVTPGAVDRVCVEIARLLPVDGVAVTIAPAGGWRVTSRPPMRSPGESNSGS